MDHFMSPRNYNIETAMQPKTTGDTKNNKLASFLYCGNFMDGRTI